MTSRGLFGRSLGSVDAVSGIYALPQELKDWVVDSAGLAQDVKLLGRAYRPDWWREAFEPSLVLSPNEPVPLVHHERPRLPVLKAPNFHRTFWVVIQSFKELNRRTE